MPKIKNLANGPVSVYCGGISMAVPPGEFLESDGFTADELKFYGAHPEEFEVVGDAVEGTGNAEALKTVTIERDDARAKLAEIVELFGSDDVNADNVKDAVAKLIQAQGDPVESRADEFGNAVVSAYLVSGITVEGGEEKAKAAGHSIAQFAPELAVDGLSFSNDGGKFVVNFEVNGKPGSLGIGDDLNTVTTDHPTDLAAAIALLDDANDDHWTQAGLPDISTLKALTGGDVTRAQVDQLPEGDRRVRKV